ncbi:molybdopterin-dependent oxidoreductase [Aeromicrobium fastidiosum]|uniref:molybdopterin-dependent oxidoreductase n=1 Tax=Aeromicrobium fastidiosum TaxID=52699 RepID=UPI001E0013D1|nr:molybdopterin-dependent oxidoreductase [Aeromicrobium fastidiosum]MBP2389301.1 DMSO/TMAO reductase YedYZ molybdopterin-dependent catalytic subunit [Aeromicrobium fastidiosum]
MRSRATTAAGVLAAAAAIAASEALAAVLDLRESPLLSVGQSVIALTPGPVAEAIIGVVGTGDKPLAVASVAVAILVLGGVVGRWWQTRRLAAFSLVAVLVVLAVASVLSRPYASPEGVFASVAGGVVLMGVLQLLLREGQHTTVDASRRIFLRTAAAVAVATVVVGAAGQALASRHRRREVVERARAALKIPTRAVVVPAGADLDIQGQAPWLTSNRDFYRIDTALQAPLIDPAEWRLRIHGMVDRELTLSYQDLLDRGLTDAWITICCVSNEVGGDLIGNTVWGGVPIKGILEEVGVRAGADALLSTSEDGWTCGTPIDALMDGRDALLALTMNGEPLPVPHGFPVRQVVPGLYGYVSATKWVTDWEVTRFADFEAYWTQRGWGERGPVKTQSRIDVPADGSTVDAGTMTIAGVAWAQHVGIERVEVRIDDADWREATLAVAPNPDTWVQWSIDWDAEPGRHDIQVRATDATGATQTAERADVLPDGATGYDGITVSVG